MVIITLDLHAKDHMGGKTQEGWKLFGKSQDTFMITKALFICLKTRDPYTAAHSLHMAQLSYMLASCFDKENAPLYYAGSLTHDIGKLGMNDHVLKGKGILSAEERGYLREHVIDGYKILSELGMPQTMLDIVKYHHERFNGSGYLEGLQGNSIPLPGRITSITDTYSALTSDRPYAKAKDSKTAISIMLEDKEQFDPLILKYFIQRILQDKTNGLTGGL